jgi:hypothetical protein
MQLQMQMASLTNPAMMMPPWPPTMPPMMAPMLNVRVDGLKFEYQLTEDDVRKVFSRYGEVYHVVVDREGTNAQVQFEQPHQAMAAQHDLDRKQLAGMSGAFLHVEFATPGQSPFGGPALPAQASPMLPVLPNVMPGGYPGLPVPPSIQTDLGGPRSPNSSRPKKYTCKLEVGIENDSEFRVASRVIQIARQIWQDPPFQQHGGKTRLRGKGIGGPHEAEEPLALCISCRDSAAFDRAVQYAEMQLQKVHTDFRSFCQQKGRPVPGPELAVKVSKKGASFGSPLEDQFGGMALTSGAELLSRGDRPPNAPGDDEIERFIEERNESRKAGNYKKADEIREYLKQVGVVLMDEKGAKGNFKGNEITKWRFWRP